MWKPALGVAAVAVVLAMSGCGASVEAGQPAKSAVGTTATSAPVETSAATAAPITMPPVDPATQSEAQKAGFIDENDWFLRSVKSTWLGGDAPSDDELLSAASLACEELGNGSPRDAVTVVVGDGEDAATNNSNAVWYAVMALCPQFG